MTLATVTALLEELKGEQQHQRERRRLVCMSALDNLIEQIVEEEAAIAEEDTRQSVPCGIGSAREGGQFRYVEDQTLAVEADGESLLGFYAERGQSFSGSADGCPWKASIRKAQRRGRGRTSVVVLTLDVEAN